MAKKIESLRGMEDILPGEVEKWQWLESKAHQFFGAWNFDEIRTPIVEYTDLFSRSIGETTDIVHKEMYTFEDRGGRSLTMRPEMTASVARAVIQNNLLRNGASPNLYYIGPMFRAERPQAGRKRQFHQIGAEIVNEGGVDADLHIIRSAYYFLKSLNLQDVKIKLNDLTIISSSAGSTIREKLRSYFESHKDKLDKDSLYRLDKNVLRIFDSKAPEMQAVIDEAPWEDIAPLSDDFKMLMTRLEADGIPCELNRRLVRGLDYYTGCVFEITSSGLGAQDALAGGGRYDGLYEELGGPKSPCTGFSIGMERLMLALTNNEPSLEQQVSCGLVYLAPFSDDLEVASQAESLAREAARKLKSIGLDAVNGGLQKSLSNHLKRAGKRNARCVLMIGADEVASGQWQLRWMEEQTQETVKAGDLLITLLRKIRGTELL